MPEINEAYLKELEELIETSGQFPVLLHNYKQGRTFIMGYDGHDIAEVYLVDDAKAIVESCNAAEKLIAEIRRLEADKGNTLNKIQAIKDRFGRMECGKLSALYVSIAIESALQDLLK